ncbi:hypothetical protein HOLleu_04571 [Holothuria leucospilota]|uniref:Uncharacterized protein n=1 Tax=Holothuria leucospilota TaxID=206669 RepID=A0A9Q1HLY1_HOLLE|nr:hypothetical protein HOLleu_04571 [Holothuria leucospilota]
MAKVLTYTSHSSYITFVRCFFLVLTLPLVEFDEAANCDTTDLSLYFTCAIFGVLPSGTAVLSFTLMGVGDSTAIEFGGSLILVGIIGHFVLDEKLSIPYFILLLVDCLGIIFVVKPSFVFRTSQNGQSSKEIGAIVSLGGAFLLSLYQIFIRNLENRNTLHCFLLMVVRGLVGMAVCGVWTTVESAWEIPTTWFDVCIFVGYGFVSTMQSVIGVKALANEEAKNVAMALTLSVVLSYVLQLTVFEDKVDLVSTGGAVIVVVCVALSATWNLLLEKLDRVSKSSEKLDEEMFNLSRS